MQSKWYLIKSLNPYGIYNFILRLYINSIVFLWQLFYIFFAPDIILRKQLKKITVYTQRYKQQRTTNNPQETSETNHNKCM